MGNYTFGVLSLVLLSFLTSAGWLRAGFAVELGFRGTDPTGDIFLESVYIPAVNETVIDFSLVDEAVFLTNNTTGASADTGDTATVGLVEEFPTEAQFVGALGNLNLTSIIDTEEAGIFQVDLRFDEELDNLIVFERGLNSQLRAQVIDEFGNPLGRDLLLGAGDHGFFDAGFEIDTTEIAGTQPVGVIGLSVERDFGIPSGTTQYIRFSSEASYGGPDWKFVGTSVTLGLPPAIPEPASFGFFVVSLGGLLLLSRRASR